jgi:hypothetical protein
MEHMAKQTSISVPELILVAGTRVILGCGIGFLLGNRLSYEQRKAMGWALFGAGALSTIPLALEIFGGGGVQEKARPHKAA